MRRQIRNLALLGMLWSIWGTPAGEAKELSEAQPLDQVIVVATGGNTVQRRFARTVDVLQDGVLVLNSGIKVDTKDRSTDEIATALIEAAVEEPEERTGDLLLYRQPLGETGIFVGGAVVAPQFVPVSEGLRLEDAIAVAGGRTPHAEDLILIIRGDGQKFSRVFTAAEWNNTLLFSRDRIIVFYREAEG